MEDYDPYKIDIMSGLGASLYSPYDSRLSLNRGTSPLHQIQPMPRTYSPFSQRPILFNAYSPSDSRLSSRQPSQSNSRPSSSNQHRRQVLSSRLPPQVPKPKPKVISVPQSTEATTTRGHYEQSRRLNSPTSNTSQEFY